MTLLSGNARTIPPPSTAAACQGSPLVTMIDTESDSRPTRYVTSPANPTMTNPAGGLSTSGEPAAIRLGSKVTSPNEAPNHHTQPSTATSAATCAKMPALRCCASAIPMTPNTMRSNWVEYMIESVNCACGLGSVTSPVRICCAMINSAATTAATPPTRTNVFDMICSLVWCCPMTDTRSIDAGRVPRHEATTGVDAGRPGEMSRLGWTGGEHAGWDRCGATRHHAYMAPDDRYTHGHHDS